MLDVKTVLVTLRPYLDNQFGGFRDTLNELQSEEKEKFISDCQYIIQNGWDKKFKKNPNLEFLHELMSDPGKALKLDSSYNKATRYIIRLCLFRLLVDASKENPGLVRDTRWFRDTHTKLAHEFAAFNNAQNPVLIFRGQRIESLHDIARLRANLQEEAIDHRFSYGHLAIKGVVVLSMGSSFLRTRMSAETQLAVSIAISMTALLLLLYRCAPKIRMAQTYFFANRAEQQLQNNVLGPERVLEDNNVQKFIAVTEEDLKQLEQKGLQPTRK